MAPPSVNGFIGQKSILRQMVVAPNLQTAWGTPVVQASLTEALRYDIAGFVKIQRPKESTYGQAGALNSFANENWTVGQKLSLDIGGMLNDWMAGWLFGIALGKETVVGAAAPYTHTINFLDQSTIAPPTTIYAKDTNDLAYQMIDMGISQLTISSTATGALKFKASLMGTGRIVSGILAGLPTPVARQHLYGHDSAISIGPAGGALTSVYPRVRSWELTIDTGLAEERASGSGLYASYLSIAMPKVKFKMSVAANSVDDIQGWKLNDTMLQLTCNTTSGGSSLNIAIPNFTIDENAQLTDSHGTAAWNIDLGEMDILQVGATPLITITVINSQASYLAAA